MAEVWLTGFCPECGWVGQGMSLSTRGEGWWMQDGTLSMWERGQCRSLKCSRDSKYCCCYYWYWYYCCTCSLVSLHSHVDKADKVILAPAINWHLGLMLYLPRSYSVGLVLRLLSACRDGWTTSSGRARNLTVIVLIAEVPPTVKFLSLWPRWDRSVLQIWPVGSPWGQKFGKNNLQQC